MIGRRAGRRRGAPAASKPSSTRGALNVGSMSGTGASSASLPCSTSCSAAIAVTILVIEAMRNTVSPVIAVPAARSRTPKAPA